MTDINRTSSGIVLPNDVSQEILSKTLEASVIQSASRRIDLPGRGTAINIITGEPVADWVGETSSKPVSNGTALTKVLRPYKLAVIETFSNEFRRDLPALYQALVSRLPNALALKFDTTVFHGNTPGSDFDSLTNAATAELTYDGLVDAIADIGNDGYDLNGVIVSPGGEAAVLKLKDLQERPLFISNLQGEGGIGSLLARPVFKSRAAGAEGVLGYTGDWTQAVYGTVGDVTIKVSDQATLTSGNTTINLFQQNMFAVLAEIEVGFRIGDLDAFRKLVPASNGAAPEEPVVGDDD
jgi:HK97 family phage major capsid protein